MQSRPLGNTGLSTSELGFGCARIGGVFHGSSRGDILQLLRRAYDSGITLFDTADMYTQGESERLVGEALRDVRQHVLIATKGGYLLPAQKRLISRIKPLVKPLVARLGLRPGNLAAGLRGTVSAQNFSAEYLVHAVDASLRRLGTDYIDLYQLHSPSVDNIARGEFVDALESLRVAGKIRQWGIACDGSEEALAALRHDSVRAIQIGLSALEQAALDAAIPEAARRGAGVIARQVFASGLLTRPPEAVVAANLDVDPLVAQRKHEQIQAFASIAQRCGRDPAALALQFALAQPGVSTVLLGMSRPHHLGEALRAAQSAPLTAEEADLLVTARRAGR